MASRVRISSENYTVSEGDRFALVTILREGKGNDLNETVTVRYSTNTTSTGTSATAGADYTVVNNGSVTFAKKQTSVTIQVPIADDSALEGTETFGFTISSVTGSSGNTGLSFPRTATIEILDNDAVAPPPPPPPPPPPTGEPPALQISEQAFISGLTQPIAFDWVPGQPSTMVVAEKAGLIKVFQGTSSYTLLDLRAVVNNTVYDRGLLDIELHPNFASQPYLYAYYAVDPPDVDTRRATATENDDPDGDGNRYAQLVRYQVTTDTSGRLSVVPGSAVILLGSAGDSLNDISGRGAIASELDPTLPPSGIVNGTNVEDYIAIDSASHAAGGLEFGPDGMLYVTVGDGTSYNFADARTVRVQDIDNLSGKVLRINPLTGDGVPTNPFYESASPDSNQSKVYQLGVRNAFRLGFDADGDLFLGDVGWNSWEEINTGPAGANFGWPYYEGGQNGNIQTPGYSSLSQAQTFYASGTPVVAPFEAFSHAEGDPGEAVQAIVFGDVYTGAVYPSWFYNRAFIADLNDGQVLVVDTTSGQVNSLTTHSGPIVFMDQGPDGLMYFADLNNGYIGRWQISAVSSTNGAPVASADSATTAVGTPVSINVLSNDTDPNGDVLRITTVSTPTNGTALIDTRGTTNPADDVITYTPSAGFTGTATFNYTISDGALSSSAGVTVRVGSPAAVITAQADDAYQLYINGTQVLSGSSWDQVQQIQVTLNAGDQIAVRGVDTGGVAGAFFDIRLSDGTQVGSSGNWKVAPSAAGDWTSASYNDSSWAAATQYGGYNAAPWNSSGLPSDSTAQWIWSSDNFNVNEVFLRFTVPDVHA